MSKGKKRVEDKNGRWEANEVSPSKYRSPTRYAEDAHSDEYSEPSELMWTRDGSGLSNEQIKCYMQCTSHLPKDIALSILKDKNYNIAAAVEFCNGVEIISDLSPVEKKVLLSAAPIANQDLGVKSKPAVAAEKHILGLLPHIRPEAIRKFFNEIGREGCIPPRGWVPKVGHILKPAHERLERSGLITADEESSLYERPGRRVLRSAAITAHELNVIPRKLGKKSNDLAIAMVGYDQHQSGDEDASPERRPIRPTHRSIRSASERPQSSNHDSRDGIKRGRGRPRKYPLPMETSPLGLSSRPSSPSSSSQTPPSSSSSNGISPNEKKRKNPLGIEMNWKPSDGDSRTRRMSTTVMENGFLSRSPPPVKKEKKDANGEDGPSTSRSSDGSNGRRMRESSISSPSNSPEQRRMTRSSSVCVSNDSPSSIEFSANNKRRSRDNLRIDMVGYDQQAPKIDSEGFAIPSIPLRSPRNSLRSPTRSRQTTPSPNASPDN